MATKWSVDDLIENIKRRGVIPTAQMTYLIPDFLAMINDELLSYGLSILHSYREDYYVEKKTVDFLKPDKRISGFPAWRIPDYAIANSLRDIVAISSSLYRYSIPRLVLDDVPGLVNFGWYFEGDYVVVRYDDNSTSPKPRDIEFAYHVRPNLVCQEKDAWSINSININTPGPGETEVKVSGPDVLQHTQDELDFIHGKSSFDVMARSVFPMSTPDFETFVFESAVVPEDLKEGDWISAVNTTPFPMLPSEMHGLLAQRVAVKFLEEQGEENQLKNAIENMVDLEKKVMMLFSPRVEGKPKKIVNRLGLWRRWRW